jgi:hypothetical protein
MEVSAVDQNTDAAKSATASGRRQLLVVATSLVFSILQSVCTAIIAINGIRLAIGLGSLVMAVGFGAAVDRFHETTWLRLTLMLGAVSGSIATLFIVLRARKLRNKSSARWRLQPLTLRQRRMEILQIGMSILTLSLVIIEECLHYRTDHTL